MHGSLRSFTLCNPTLQALTFFLMTYGESALESAPHASTNLEEFMTPEMHALSQRLEGLEKQVAHLAALVTEQTDNNRTVVAQRFVVRDEENQRRAELGIVRLKGETEAQPWLGLFDANGRIRTAMSVEANGGRLELYNPQGQAVLELKEYREGPRLALFDATGSTRLSLTVSEDGSFIYLFNADGKQNLRLELHSSGEECLVMQDANGNPRVLLAANGERGPVIAFFKNEEVFWQVP